MRTRQLLEKSDKIHDVSMGIGLYITRKDYKIHSDFNSINSLYWTFVKSIDDACMSSNNFQFACFNSNIHKITTFKKD